MPTTVTKSLEFCYGHRLLNYDGKCAMLHGHNARIEVDYTVERVDPKSGFAIDFSDLKKGVGGWMNETLDHLTFLQSGDPIADALARLNEPFVEVTFRPTAENIAAWILSVAVSMHGENVSAVRLWETPSSFVEVKNDLSTTV
jgi:6-pyruvoyltetrahydropterin/6-carboxytetrahydropterin synthase